MVEESDGADEMVYGALRVGIVLAARAAEQRARAREQAAREAEAINEQQARAQQTRIQAERDAARATLAAVHEPGWWDQANRADIATAWETARTWYDRDPEAQRAEQAMRHQLQERYGIDVDNPGADPDALRRAEQARDEAETQRGQAEQDTEMAWGLLGADDRDQQQNETEHTGTVDEARQWYDSADRREDLARHLEGVADEATAEAVVTADQAQAKEPEQATRTPQRQRVNNRRKQRAQGRRAERDLAS